MTIPALPAEKRNQIIAEIEKLGRFPSVKESKEIAKRHGASPSTVRRIALKVAPPAGHQTQSPPAKGKDQLFRESVSPAIAKPRVRSKPEAMEAEAEDRDPRSCGDCREEITLEDGERWEDVNTCPGCGSVFA